MSELNKDLNTLDVHLLLVCGGAPVCVKHKNSPQLDHKCFPTMNASIYFLVIGQTDLIPR